MKLLRYFTTANAALAECSELTSSNAVTLAAVPADGWYLISPTGTFPDPDRSYVQVFGEEQARDVVSTFNSFAGRAARHIKNLWHGAGFTDSIPIFEGHSDRDRDRWPTMNRLGDITDLRADQAGLWGMVTWNAAGLAKRTREFGPLKPSPVYWHEKPDATGRVYPAMLESVGLVRIPNIATAPTWTANALPGPAPEENQNQNDMKHREQLIALLGLKSDADDAAIQSSLDAHGAKVTSTANALSAAEAAKADLETQLSTANAAKDQLLQDVESAKTANATLVTERDTLKSTNETLTTANAALIEGALDVAERAGAITPAERPDFKVKLTTANSAATTLTELKTRKAMNTQPVIINGQRTDLSTANARADAYEKAITERMKVDNIDRDAAVAKVKADPAYAALFAAMADPTRKAA